jgi:hypothetical protein
MKIAMYIVLTVVWFLYVADTTITFKPFTIHLAKPSLAFAWLLLIISILLFQHQSYKEGSDDTMNKVMKVIEDVTAEENKGE